MNFVMGFLFSCYKDKQLSLKMFIALFNNFLGIAYKDNLNGVNLIFFNID